MLAWNLDDKVSKPRTKPLIMSHHCLFELMLPVFYFSTTDTKDISSHKLLEGERNKRERERERERENKLKSVNKYDITSITPHYTDLSIGPFI